MGVEEQDKEARHGGQQESTSEVNLGEEGPGEDFQKRDSLQTTLSTRGEESSSRDGDVVDATQQPESLENACVRAENDETTEPVSGDLRKEDNHIASSKRKYGETKVSGGNKMGDTKLGVNLNGTSSRISMPFKTEESAEHTTGSAAAEPLMKRSHSTASKEKEDKTVASSVNTTGRAAKLEVPLKAKLSRLTTTPKPPFVSKHPLLSEPAVSRKPKINEGSAAPSSSALSKTADHTRKRKAEPVLDPELREMLLRGPETCVLEGSIGKIVLERIGKLDTDKIRSVSVHCFEENVENEGHIIKCDVNSETCYSSSGQTTTAEATAPNNTYVTVRAHDYPHFQTEECLVRVVRGAYRGFIGSIFRDFTSLAESYPGRYCTVRLDHTKKLDPRLLRSTKSLPSEKVARNEVETIFLDALRSYSPATIEPNPSSMLPPEL